MRAVSRNKESSRLYLTRTRDEEGEEGYVVPESIDITFQAPTRVNSKSPCLQNKYRISKKKTPWTPQINSTCTTLALKIIPRRCAPHYEVLVPSGHGSARLWKRLTSPGHGGANHPLSPSDQTSLLTVYSNADETLKREKNPRDAMGVCGGIIPEHVNFNGRFSFHIKASWEWLWPQNLILSVLKPPPARSNFL